jgi:glucose uptake protein GlcU
MHVYMSLGRKSPHDRIDHLLGYCCLLLQVLQEQVSSTRSGLGMFVIEDKGGAIALMLASLLFLGTWPAVLTLLERRGRLPQHTYLDYSITNLLAAVLIALTFGQLGDSRRGMPNFFTQLGQDNWPSVLFAMAGGVVLSVGNLSTQYAWAYVGLSVTEVISSSMVVVIGRLASSLIIIIT